MTDPLKDKITEPHMLNEEPSLTAIVEKIEKTHQDIRILTIKPEALYPYKAGQYTRMAFNDMAPRSYSIASGAHEQNGVIEIHVKRGKGEASVYIMEELQEGERVKLFPAQGDMIYDHAAGRDIVLVGGGLGITPLKAIIEQAFYEGHKQDITLFWGAETEDQLYLREIFERMAAQNSNFSVHMVTGQNIIDAMKTQNNAAGHNSHVFLSGPPAMINATVPFLIGQGVPSTAISYDPHPEAVKVKP